MKTILMQLVFSLLSFSLYAQSFISGTGSLERTSKTTGNYSLDTKFNNSKANLEDIFDITVDLYVYNDGHSPTKRVPAMMEEYENSYSPTSSHYQESYPYSPGDSYSDNDSNYSREREKYTPQPKSGKTIETIVLAGRTWLAQNLNYDIGEGNWCYDNNPANCRKYGRLYTWAAAKKACAALGNGWRLPTDREWLDLANSYGGVFSWLEDTDPGKSYKALREGGSSRFNALLGGYRDNYPTSFEELGETGAYWSATEDEEDANWARSYEFYPSLLFRESSYKLFGLSCRCVKDNSDADDYPREKEKYTPQPKSGKTIETIVLAGRVWLAQNLNYDIGEGSWCYDNDPANCQKYGRLYTWTAARKACAALGNGWRLPTEQEWRSLAISFGGYIDVKTEKLMGFPWKSRKALLEGGSSGFNALLGGGVGDDGVFDLRGTAGFYWSDTEQDAQLAWLHYLSEHGPTSTTYGKSNGLSCRCVKD